jgi:hypothetical protein
MTQPLENWFHVTFDDKIICLDIHPGDQDNIQTQIRWADIRRICFKPGDFLSSDEVYIFTNQRPESYLIPLEAHGGIALWMEILNRGLFDYDLAVEASTATDGIICWPNE